MALRLFGLEGSGLRARGIRALRFRVTGFRAPGLGRPYAAESREITSMYRESWEINTQSPDTPGLQVSESTHSTQAWTVEGYARDKKKGTLITV